MTTTEKNALISGMILARLAAGEAMREAIDAVLGAGRYEAIIDDLYETFRAQAGK